MIDQMTQQFDKYDILIIDDARESLWLLNRILEERGYRVRPATSGRLALKSAAAKVPDLILLDVKMPEMDGYEVCRRLKSNEQSRKIPVIFISAHGESAKKVEGFKAGGVDFITKPFERQEVLARVEIHLRLHELTEHLEQQVEQRTRQLRQEIAERKRTEEILQQSEERYRSIFENAVEGIFQATPGAKGRFVSANPAHARILGYDSPEQMMAQVTEIGPRIWIDPHDRKVFSEQVAKGAVTGFEAQMRRRDGRSIWVSLNARPVSDASGELDYIEGIMLDITDRKQAEEKLNEYREHLEELVRDRTAQFEAANKELHNFTYTVSHDLRAPLRHIDGFVELLQKKAGTALDENSRHYMDNISEAAKKMGLLIDELLAFSRMGRHLLSLQRVALKELVHDILGEFEPETAGRRIDWRIGDLPVVNGDAAMLRIVLGNLIANALKFTRPRQEAQIEIGSQPGQNAEAVIFVRDNGVGFDMTYADKLFGVFQRLHGADQFEGTGIGLANVRRIIARHGGRTWAQAEPGQGAIFFFSLPHTV
ncbi:MAG: response regulator [Desulfobacteraceae bacterium]